MKQKLSFTVLAILIVCFTGLAIYGAIHNSEVIHSKNIQIESKTFKLQKLETEFKQLNANYQKEKDNKTLDQTKEEQYQKQIQDLEEQYKVLEVSKAAEKAQRSQLAQAQTRLANAIVPTASAATISGTKDDWLRAAGIPESDWWAVDSIVSRESSWRPDALGSLTELGRACGLAQALPCSKVGDNWADPVVSLKWQYAYVTARYGGYPQAVAFWNSNHWY